MMTKGERLTLADLIAGLTEQGGVSTEALSEAASVQISRAVIDSRLATPGCLFIALRGEHHNGHDFIAEAIGRGAVAVIAEKAPPAEKGYWILDSRAFQCPISNVPNIQSPACLIVPNSLAALQQVATHWRRQQAVRVVGVTGSVGKTISKEAIAAVLRRRYRTLKSEGNYNNEIGLPLTLLHLTTAHERAVLEMGMYNLGEIAQLARIARPQVGVVTNVGPTHLERLGTIERIAQAKAELPQALPPAEEGGVAVLNADDERVAAMAGQTQARLFTYGLTPAADLWADEIESAGLAGIRFALHYQGQTVRIHAPLLGRHSVHTALCAAAVGLVEGLTWEEIVAGLQDPSVQLRLVVVPGPAGSTLLDDTYNASPASCLAALRLLAELQGRKIAVLGDMYELGSFEEEGHRLVGRQARQVADRLVAVGRLGRIIGEEALQAGMPAEAVHLAETNEQAIALLQTLIQGGDVVLIKGSRGMKMEQIVAALSRPPAGRQAGGKQP
mgnify:CR=1 FL=1